MKRRQPTQEQKEAAAARREKMRELSRRVGSMTDDQRAALVAGQPVISAEGRILSIKNSCLLIAQLSSVSMVGGFNQWRAVGRKVRAGERSLCIWKPLRTESDDPAGSEGDEAGTDTEERPRFRLVSVFDITQTHEIGAEDSGAVVHGVGAVHPVPCHHAGPFLSLPAPGKTARDLESSSVETIAA
jgi:hypothetical protein